MRRITSSRELRPGMRIRHIQGETWWEGRVEKGTRFIVERSSRDVQGVIGTSCGIPFDIGKTFVVSEKLQLF